MIQYKDNLTEKEFIELKFILKDLKDFYLDFYITKDNLRLFIKDNPELLEECLKKDEKIAFCKKGIAFTYGLKDERYRTYVKIVAEDKNTADKLLQVIDWNLKYEILYCKVKKNNPIVNVLKNRNFKFNGSRGKEILLKKEANNE